MQVDCIEKHIFSGISDYFRPFLTDVLTALNLFYDNIYSVSRTNKIPPLTNHALQELGLVLGLGLGLL